MWPECVGPCPPSPSLEAVNIRNSLQAFHCTSISPLPLLTRASPDALDTSINTVTALGLRDFPGGVRLWLRETGMGQGDRVTGWGL